MHIYIFNIFKSIYICVMFKFICDKFFCKVIYLLERVKPAYFLQHAFCIRMWHDFIHIWYYSINLWRDMTQFIRHIIPFIGDMTSFTRDMSHPYVIWLHTFCSTRSSSEYDITPCTCDMIQFIRDMTHSYVAWLIRNMAQSYVIWLHTFCSTPSSPVCDMTPFVCDMTQFIRDMTQSYVIRLRTFCGTRSSFVCDMTPFTCDVAWLNSFVTCLMHMWHDMTLYFLKNKFCNRNMVLFNVLELATSDEFIVYCVHTIWV